MSSSPDLYRLPEDLPVPEDDGACDHLPGLSLPDLDLAATSGGTVNLARVTDPWLVVYCYPMTGAPGVVLPEGWDQIPGARGCTPQSCVFRDLHGELRDAGAQVFGLSTQTTEYQREAQQRLHLPFELLSDAELRFTRSLRLPTFAPAGVELLKRVTLLARGGVIRKVFYPIFPPTANPPAVLQWIRASAA